MIVINQADLILDETYLVSTESRGYIQEPTSSPFQPAPTLPLPPPDPDSILPFLSDPPCGLPDLVPLTHRDSHSPAPIKFAKPVTPHQGREQLIVEMGHEGVQIRDLVHPGLTEPLRAHQHSTFKLVKLVSDFNHQLSRIHEQHAEDMAQLVEAFRKKTADIQNEGPRYTNSIALAWEQWMADVMQDSACHTEISAVLGRAVARPLLEKTFHMKIQSRKVFTQRENYERLLADSEDRLAKSHGEYRMSWAQHLEKHDPTTLAAYLEAHNGYVGQIHGINGMIDQYYVESLPHLLQELDDVYHDVSAVVLESLTEGSNKITEKTLNMTNRWKKTSEDVQAISAPKDISSFLSCITIPDFVPVTKHSFLPPPTKDQGNETGLPLTTCEVVLDRSVSESARARYEQLRGQAKELEANCKLISEAVESLIRIQSKNLDQQLFNKANEIQEEISRKRFDLRCAQIQLAGIRAQKELFSASTNLGGTVEGVPDGGPRDRKLSTSSTGNMKSKWVNAFKNIKGKQEAGKPSGAGPVGPPPILENSHVFQEYTYKKITPCDVCSQILRGHTRQGLKCKLCRMNVHPDCQEKVVKCQPKSKLLRRQKSASEFDGRVAGELGGEDDSGFSPRASPGLGAAAKREQWAGGGGGSHNGASAGSQESTTGQFLAVPGPGQEAMVASGPERRKMGGSYSRYTGGGKSPVAGGMVLVTDGELCDSSGRVIKTTVTPVSPPVAGMGRAAGTPVPQRL